MRQATGHRESKHLHRVRRDDVSGNDGNLSTVHGKGRASGHQDRHVKQHRTQTELSAAPRRAEQNRTERVREQTTLKNRTRSRTEHVREQNTSKNRTRDLVLPDRFSPYPNPPLGGSLLVPQPQGVPIHLPVGGSEILAPAPRVIDQPHCTKLSRPMPRCLRIDTMVDTVVRG